MTGSRSEYPLQKSPFLFWSILFRSHRAVSVLRFIAATKRYEIDPYMDRSMVLLQIHTKVMLQRDPVKLVSNCARTLLTCQGCETNIWLQHHPYGC